MSGRNLNCFQFVFGHVLDLTFGLFSVDDVCSCKCSSRCFPIADVWFFSLHCFSFLLGWRKLFDQGQNVPNDGSLFYVCRQLLFYLYAGSCYFMCAESRYFIFMLTAVQEQRSRLFYVYLIYAESRT